MWTVLLIGGVSAGGKSTAARRIGLELGLPWMQLDDIRLALQRMRVRLPADTDRLYFFLQKDPWKNGPSRLRDELIATGELMLPAFEAVVENHLAQDEPLILEGDGILPSILSSATIRGARQAGTVRAVFLVESDEHALRTNFERRGRGFGAMATKDQDAEVQAKLLFSNWVEQESRREALPVLPCRPANTLPRRILSAVAT